MVVGSVKSDVCRRAVANTNYQVSVGLCSDEQFEPEHTYIGMYLMSPVCMSGPILVHWVT